MHFSSIFTTVVLSASLASATFEASYKKIDADIQERGWSESLSAPEKRQGSSGTIVQIVTVSDNNGSLSYFPEQITAEPGTLVQFQFYPKNHTVTESSFAAPCVPLAVSNASAITPTNPGIKSGFVPVNATADIQFRPAFNILINDTKPIWLYCGQTGHCEKGMAMVINQNPNDTVKTLANYKKAAAQIAIPGSNSTSSSSYGYGSGSTATAVSTAGPAGATVTSAGPSLSASSTAAASPSAFTGGAVPAKLGSESFAAVAGVVAAGLIAWA